MLGDRAGSRFLFVCLFVLLVLFCSSLLYLDVRFNEILVSLMQVRYMDVGLFSSQIAVVGVSL